MTASATSQAWATTGVPEDLPRRDCLAGASVAMVVVVGAHTGKRSARRSGGGGSRAETTQARSVGIEPVQRSLGNRAASHLVSGRLRPSGSPAVRDGLARGISHGDATVRRTVQQFLAGWAHHGFPALAAGDQAVLDALSHGPLAAVNPALVHASLSPGPDALFAGLTAAEQLQLVNALMAQIQAPVQEPVVADEVQD